VPADLTRPDEVRAAVGRIRAEYGRIDVLVNNAGGDIGPAGATAPGGGRPPKNDGVFVALEDVRAVIDRNLLSCIYVCREVAPEMMERRAGRIVNLGSVAGLSGHAEGVMYAAAKAAVHEYTRCLAVQLRPYNVTVNCVAPGGTMTARFVATGQARPHGVERIGTLEGYGQPEDIARAVEYFVTDAGRHVSGQVLRVDGGAQTWPA
jgi:3-oxoacyl-[acyl-carrier protein] reductase